MYFNFIFLILNFAILNAILSKLKKKISSEMLFLNDPQGRTCIIKVLTIYMHVCLYTLPDYPLKPFLHVHTSVTLKWTNHKK